MMKNALYVIISVILALVCSFALCVEQPEDKPSVEQIYNALKQQEATCGLSLYVCYTVNPLVPPKNIYPAEDVKYIRTPDVLFKEVTYWRVSESGERNLHRVTKFRWDRKTGEFKSLATFAGDDLHMAYTLNSQEIPSRFAGDGLIDPVLYRMPIGPLVDVIKDCDMSGVRDNIDGHQCWNLIIPNRRIGPDTSGDWSFWLDSEIGYCPRRIVQNTNGSIFTTNFSDYKAVRDGVYFPMLVETKYNSSGQDGQRIVVQEVKCGESFAPKDLDIEFPSGTSVYAIGKGTSYTVP